MAARKLFVTGRVGAAAMAVAAVLALADTGAAQAPGDLVWDTPGAGAAGAGFDPSFFPHWLHRIRYRCSVCHPALFEMKLGASEITMDKINKGQACGVCHNGQIAFAVDFASCNRCHLPRTE